MKKSVYNHFIDNGDSIIIFNAYKVSFLSIRKEVYKELISYKNNLNKLETGNPKLFKTLYDNGIIIPDYLNEKEAFLNKVIDRKFSSESYHVIINMTMDCNLRCWYCYENHIENSQIKNDIVSSLLKHIKLKYEKSPFKYLTLSFFGGEPLLYKDKILFILSHIKKIADIKGFKLTANFTTNSTLLTKEFVLELKNYHTSFQITLDGCREVHNKIRKYKDSNFIDSFENILNSLSLIKNYLNDYELALRINISPQTSNNLVSIIPEIEKKIDKLKTKINIYKVWQVDAKKIDENMINELVKKFQLKGFVCTYLKLNYCLSGCYSDNINEVVINYDGMVYKCTARKFDKDNSYGYLKKDGTIVWDYTRLMNRLSLQIPKACVDCDILPVCPKLCSQTLLEKKEPTCILKDSYTKVDYIIELLNNISAK